MRVIIIGAGMNGATLALALSNSLGPTIDIQIIESTESQSKAHPGFDARSIAIANGTYLKLNQLGLWTHFKSQATAIKKIWVFEERKPAKLDMTNTEYHLDALGHVVPLYDVGQSLYQAIDKTPNIKLWSGYRVGDIHRTQEEVHISIEKNRQSDDSDDGIEKKLSADLVVIADGTQSESVKKIGFQKQIDEYHQTALITNIKSTLDHNGQAFEMFTEEGPIALLPMNEGVYSLVWCASQSTISEKMALSDDEFLTDLQRRFSNRLGHFTQAGQRFSYELDRHVIDKPISHRVVVIGNAAQTLHPIAGQGFNLGMRDITHLCEVLKLAQKNHLDIGAYQTLSMYLNRRLKDRNNTLFFTHQLVKWFSNQETSKAIARQAGLALASKCKYLKDKIAYQALGWLG